MTISPDLYTLLANLDRSEKLHVIQYLVNDLAAEDATRLKPGATFDVWSPYDAASAAITLTRLLEDSGGDDA